MQKEENKEYILKEDAQGYLLQEMGKLVVKGVPFWDHLVKGWYYDRDPITRPNFSKGLHLPIYNLSCTRRDLEMYVKHGVKPTRHWRLKDAKFYFGIKGTGQTLLDNFYTIYNAVMPLALPNTFFDRNIEMFKELQEAVYFVETDIVDDKEINTYHKGGPYGF